MKFFKERKYEIYRQFLLILALIFLSVALERVTSGRRYDEEFPLRWFLIRIPILSVIGFTIVAHYYWLYDRYVVHKKYGKYLLLLFGFLIFAIILDFGTNALFSALGVWDERTELLVLFRVSIERVLIADMPFAYVYAAVRQYQKVKKEQRVLELEQHKNEMLLLRGKLEPEFIYNTINTLNMIAQNEQAPKTAAYMCELKELFRYSTEDASNEKIPIQKELDFIERYIKLQRMRIVDDSNIKIETNASWDNVGANIAPMLLLPFIENAFKYGISYENPSAINIKVGITEQRLVFTCDNTNHSGILFIDSMGTGLANTIKRLELQYKNKYELEHRSENGRYTVSLMIDLN